MKVLTLVTALLFGPMLAVADLTTLSIDDLNTTPPQPQSTACGVINDQYLYNDYQFFEAALARECLTSVPFNAAVATRFVAWYNQTLQFHTTPAFLRHPPGGYQQPAADIYAQLRQIQDRIDADYYRNQYVFDADVFSLIKGGHDTHLDLWAGALSQFSWGAPFQIVSVSRDGKEPPKVYFWYKIKNYNINGTVSSPIKSINNVPVLDYLQQYAAHQSFDQLEPHADWNNLMRTPAMQIMGYRSVFSSESTFYPGADELNVQYEDETWYNQTWLARYNSPGFTGSLETGGDFYNLFVLGLLPASYNQSYDEYQQNRSASAQQSSQRRQSASETTNWHDLTSAYPNDTISHQDDLGLATSGYVTGYYLDDISTAVVSIPSFDMYGDDDTSFERAIADFVNNATERGASKVIIDLQQNFGGLDSLVFEAIRQLFPSISPPRTLSRMRSHPRGDYLGSTMTSYFDTLSEDDDDYDYLVPEEWAITEYIQYDTRKNFTSWQEFYGPLAFNGDTFSRIEEYNLTSEVFDDLALEYSSTAYSSPTASNGKDPWSASNIVILTDGLCASACTLFVEIVTQQLGARTVVVGGSPISTTPMQAASGTRGARIYSSDDLAYDFAITEAITGEPYPGYLNDTGMAITYATINLRDQIRPSSDGVPNQMLYIPANCRLYWTLANFNDYDRLWHDVSNAIYADQSSCIGGYQNSSVAASTTTARAIPRGAKRSTSEVSEYINAGVSLTGNTSPPLHEDPSGFRDGKVSAQPTSQLTYCKTDADCRLTRGMCASTTITCNSVCTKGKPCQTQQKPVKVCAPLIAQSNTCTGRFQPAGATSGKKLSQCYMNKNVQGDAPLMGYCVPSAATAGTPSCNA